MDPSSQEKLTIEGTNYVNEATLELLRRRLETDVRKSFWGWVGLPVGGAGILGVVYLLFAAIPSSVGEFIANDTSVKARMDDAVVEYLQNEQTGAELIRRQVEAASDRMVTRAVERYLTSEQGQIVLLDTPPL